MEELTSSLDFLSWPIEVVNHLRAALGSLNIPMHAILAQALAAAIFVFVGLYFYRIGRSPKPTLGRLAARSVMTACAIATVSIAIAWVDNLIAPRSKEIVGNIFPVPSNEPILELLDFENMSLGVTFDSDSEGAFVVRYSPIFADPPSALRISSSGCVERDQTLSRSHLLGEKLVVRLDCKGAR